MSATAVHSSEAAFSFWELPGNIRPDASPYSIIQTLSNLGAVGLEALSPVQLPRLKRERIRRGADRDHDKFCSTSTNPDDVTDTSVQSPLKRQKLDGVARPSASNMAGSFSDGSRAGNTPTNVVGDSKKRGTPTDDVTGACKRARLTCANDSEEVPIREPVETAECSVQAAPAVVHSSVQAGFCKDSIPSTASNAGKTLPAAAASFQSVSLPPLRFSERRHKLRDKAELQPLYEEARKLKKKSAFLSEKAQGATLQSCLAMCMASVKFIDYSAQMTRSQLWSTKEQKDFFLATAKLIDVDCLYRTTKAREGPPAAHLLRALSLRLHALCLIHVVLGNGRDVKAITQHLKQGSSNLAAAKQPPQAAPEAPAPPQQRQQAYSSAAGMAPVQNGQEGPSDNISPDSNQSSQDVAAKREISPQGSSSARPANPANSDAKPQTSASDKVSDKGLRDEAGPLKLQALHYMRHMAKAQLNWRESVELLNHMMQSPEARQSDEARLAGLLVMTIRQDASPNDLLTAMDMSQLVLEYTTKLINTPSTASSETAQAQPQTQTVFSDAARPMPPSSVEGTHGDADGQRAGGRLSMGRGGMSRCADGMAPTAAPARPLPT